ncbi:MAG: glycosyltransferase family 1 protein [Bacteroidales bacterium]
MVNLFKAFDAFKSADQKGIKLLVVGEKMYWSDQIAKAYEQMKYKQEVIFSGRLKLPELKEAVGAAIALTYVSYFEGFGIPIVEAFNAETPVITSNVTSMPEVAGDAALLIDPFSVDSICDALNRMSSDEKLRQELIDKGRIQSKKFTWDKSAERLWNSMEKVLAER